MADAKLVAIDNGYWNTKVYDGESYIIFRSKVEKSKKVFNFNNTYAIYYNNEDYLVGEGATQTDLQIDKTLNPFHKICTYTALGLLSNFNITEFNLVLGYPLTYYASFKDAFADYIIEDCRNNPISIEIEGELRRFTINDILVLPQGVGALYVDPLQYENETIGIIDVGGLTINGVLFKNLNVIKNSIFTIQKGIFNLCATIIRELQMCKGIDLKDYELPNVLQKGYTNMQNKPVPEVDEFIKSIIERQAYEVFNIAKQNDWSPKTNIILTGGGAELLAPFIKKYLPNTQISSQPIWDNVEGFYNLGGEYYGY